MTNLINICCSGKESFMTKISIRFFNDREVRAVWDEGSSQWFFAAVDIVAVLNEQSDYTKNRNYWKYLKNKLKQENPQLVSAANQLKLTAPDGKKRLTDCFDSFGVIELAEVEKIVFPALAEVCVSPWMGKRCKELNNIS